MTDVLICEYSFAYDICKAKASTLRAALHISLRLTLNVAYQKSINNCNMRRKNLKTLY